MSGGAAIEIFLVRHGEPAARWGEDPDPGLSDLGREQASQASKELLCHCNGDITILSSPLRRARQTAEPLARALGLSVAIDDVFREIPAPVALPSRPAWIEQFSQQTWATQPRLLLDWRARALERLGEVGGCTVVFTHFMILNAVVGQATGRVDTVCFRPDNASITRFRRDGTRLWLVRLGSELQTVVN